ELLLDEQNEVFLRYFKNEMCRFIKKSLVSIDDYRATVITAVFIETVRWWSKNKMKHSAEEITELFLQTIGINEKGII
ncbi:MAG: TetR family transcriptional regulator C-terminal domain-containing protein, partial [Paludibacteraceae bacterium]|nr:TetR family transcriptional regulator C-terminal domain-containing protein [Paludibacteraceae bacterium]